MAASRPGSLSSVLLLVFANILIPLSIVIFATGFFPHKPFLPGLAEFETLEHGPPPAAPFDKLVFMVVDALRSDFVYSNSTGFSYTQSLIRDGQAFPFTANARSPTVTMPRIKAMTTGSIPSFVDLILNIDESDTSSSLAVQDTWLAQLRAKGAGKMLMFGDDTWLKLFPDTFDRHDGTSSFFVADFTEVDHNVTRNIAGELDHDDWGLMVLHYLGLDHIGHKAGPRSPNMIPKQQEMDDMVRQIFEAMQTKTHLGSTLLVLCGDHGMNDAGNHGASSPGETSPALLFLSPKLKGVVPPRTAPMLPKNEFDYYTTVEQSDLAPTIAGLLGFPISKNNLGAFIPDFLAFWPKGKDKAQILMRNARQILDIVTAAFGTELFDLTGAADPCALASTDVTDLACSWRKINEKSAEAASAGADDSRQDWLADVTVWLRQAQDLMSSMASNYDMPKLFLGQGLSAVAVVAAIIAAWSLGPFQAEPIIALSLVTLTYGIMMFASSYVEEEHHFWYWATTLWVAYLGVRGLRRTGHISSTGWHVAALVALRLIRSWNQTGQKFAGEPDIVKLFVAPHPLALWAVVGMAYAMVSFQILPNLDSLPYIVITGLTSVLISSAFTFKLAFTSEDAPELVVGPLHRLNQMFTGQTLLSRARLVFALLAMLSTFAVYSTLTGPPRAAKSASLLLHQVITLLAMTQSRVTNIPIFLLCQIVLQSLETTHLTVAHISTTSILLQFATFFAFGGTNAISSVDLSSAYNGIAGYNVVAVGVLTFLGNWAGPVFWTSATNLLLLRKYHGQGTAPEERRRIWRQHLSLLTVFAAASVAFVMAACTALRTHLFIWTVFSPKYLYCIAWSMGQHLVVNVVLGSLLFWLGAR